MVITILSYQILEFPPRPPRMDLSANLASTSISPGSSDSIRPPFTPIVHSTGNTSSLSTSDEKWIEPLSSPCQFSLSIFLSTMKELCLHPERNSTLILRADPLPPSNAEPERSFMGLERLEMLRVRLMPKQPKRDGKLDQRCVFYRSKTGDEGAEEHGLVIMIPEVKEVGDIPYYHPPVRQLAFRYDSVVPDSDHDPTVEGLLSIAYLPFEETTPPPSPLITIPLPPGKTRAPHRRSPLAGPPLGQGEGSKSPSRLQPSYSPQTGLYPTIKPPSAMQLSPKIDYIAPVSPYLKEFTSTGMDI